MTAATVAVRGRAASGGKTLVRGGVKRERHEPAFPLLLAVMALTAIGIVMVYSASSVRSYFSTSDPASQGLEQLVWAAIGLTGLFVASRLDFRHLRYLAIPAFVITFGLLIAVLIPGIGSEINGSRRWIVIPAVGSLQPAEFAKLALVLYLAHWLDRRGKAASSFWNGLDPVRAARGAGIHPHRHRAGPRDRGGVRRRGGRRLLHGGRQPLLPGRHRCRPSSAPAGGWSATPPTRCSVSRRSSTRSATRSTPGTTRSRR